MAEDVRADQVSAEALRTAEEYVQQEEGAGTRLTGWTGTVVTGLAVVMTLFHLYAAYDIVPTQELRYIHVAFVLLLSFLLFPLASRFRNRIQWFDITGKFLGQRKYGGQFYNVTFDAGGQLWASVHPKGVSLDDEFNVVKIDNATGKFLGRVEGRSHELGVGLDGSIYPASRSEVLLVFRPKK